MFPHDQAFTLAENLRAILAPACTQIEIAGSIRRGKPYVKDIELVAIPKPARPEFGKKNPKDQLTQRLIDLEWQQRITRENGILSKWGDRYKKFGILDGQGKPLPIYVDLFIVLPPAQWGAIFTIRTGPGSEDDNFNKALMERAWRLGLRQVDGHLEDAKTKKVIDTPDERDYFRALALPWINPADRHEAPLRKFPIPSKRRA